MCNFAELQQRIDNGTVTLSECKRMGSTHKAYGWARTPYGQWNEEQRKAYFEGYDNAKQA